MTLNDWLLWFFDAEALASLVTLVVLEIVLGIDNLIFISILTNKLPENQRARARRIGIGLALVLRLGLLGTIAIIVRATEPIDVFGINVIDEATRNSQYRGPLAPTFTPPTQHGPWAVPWTHPVDVQQDGGAVNTTSAEGGVIEIARR